MGPLSSPDHVTLVAAHIMPADGSYMSVNCHAQLTTASDSNHTSSVPASVGPSQNQSCMACIVLDAARNTQKSSQIHGVGFLRVLLLFKLKSSAPAFRNSQLSLSGPCACRSIVDSQHRAEQSSLQMHPLKCLKFFIQGPEHLLRPSGYMNRSSCTGRAASCRWMQCQACLPHATFCSPAQLPFQTH